MLLFPLVLLMFPFLPLQYFLVWLPPFLTVQDHLPISSHWISYLGQRIIPALFAQLHFVIFHFILLPTEIALENKSPNFCDFSSIKRFQKHPHLNGYILHRIISSHEPDAILWVFDRFVFLLECCCIFSHFLLIILGGHPTFIFIKIIIWFLHFLFLFLRDNNPPIVFIFFMILFFAILVFFLFFFLLSCRLLLSLCIFFLYFLLVSLVFISFFLYLLFLFFICALFDSFFVIFIFWVRILSLFIHVFFHWRRLFPQFFTFSVLNVQHVCQSNQLHVHIW